MSELDLSKAIEVAWDAVLGNHDYEDSPEDLNNIRNDVEHGIRAALPHIIDALADAADAAVELGDADATLEWLRDMAEQARQQ
jgi:hypothetical protein